MAATIVTYMWAAFAPAHALDDARIKAAASETENWLLHGRDYTDQRFSPLDSVKQYVAVAEGGSILGFRSGDAVVVFGLPD